MKTWAINVWHDFPFVLIQLFYNYAMTMDLDLTWIIM